MIAGRPGGREDNLFEQELTEETEVNPAILWISRKSFTLCCLRFLLFKASVSVSFVALKVLEVVLIARPGLVLLTTTQLELGTSWELETFTGSQLLPAVVSIPDNANAL